MSEGHSKAGSREPALALDGTSNGLLKVVSPPEPTDLAGNHLFGLSHVPDDTDFVCFLASDDSLHCAFAAELADRIATSLTPEKVNAIFRSAFIVDNSDNVVSAS